MAVKLSSFSASFHEYELDIDYYHGKDLVHQGCLLKLDPEYSWKRINSKIRNKIRSAQKLDIDIRRVEGNRQNVKDFRTIWFDPEDETLPDQLSDDEIMYLAYAEGALVGGLILTPSSSTVLYMHNLGSNNDGKKKNIPALLLWHAVEDLKDSPFDYIDVGVSFRPTLYSFFKNWQTDAYPIIFSPPFIRPDIRLTPYTGNDIPAYRGSVDKNADSIMKQYFGDTYTVLPRAIYALKAVLQHIGLKRNDSVAVYTTFGNDYLSRCVSDSITSFVDTILHNKMNNSTKAVVVVHEFGYAHKDTVELKKECERRGIPLVEDCAWSYGSRINKETRIGDVGDYAIYSLPKILPMQYGAILKGLTINDEENWNNYKLLDFFKRELVRSGIAEHMPKITDYEQTRRSNWQYLATLFKKDGYKTYVDYDALAAPGAFLIEMEGFQEAFERYEKFGIETGRYYQAESLFLPVHQTLTESQLDYLYAVNRGALNLSSNYRRDGKS